MECLICVGGMSDMCMCLARGGVRGVGGEWVTGLGLGFTNSGGTWDVSCVLVAVVGGVGEEWWVGGLGQGLGGWDGVMSLDYLC